MTWEKIQNVDKIDLIKKEMNILILTFEEYKSNDSSMKYDSSYDNNEKIAQNKNKIDTKKRGRKLI